MAAVLPPMKQSTLGFPSLGITDSTSKHHSVEVIVLDDSEEDEEFHTPPPSMLQETKKRKEFSIEIDTIRDSQGSSSRQKLTAVNVNGSSQDSSQQPPAKKPKPSVVLDKIPHSELLPDSEPIGESRICHQHRAFCKNLFQCTARNKKGYRCTLKYCFSTLRKLYKQEPNQIVQAGRNVLGARMQDHVGPAEASYLWMCPKCRGACQCSMCRKKAGLEPLGLINANGEAIDGKSRAKDATLLSTEVVEKGKGKEKETEKVKSIEKIKSKEAKVDSKSKGQHSKSKTSSTLKDSFAKVAETAQQTGKAIAEKSKLNLQQQTLPQRLRKPKQVEKPQLQTVVTRLPVPNIKERIWLYESLVRFDWFDTPKGILKNLDKFDDWTEFQLQTILEKLICRVAGISNIKTKAPRKIHQRLVEIYRETGQDLKRGEVWEVSKNYCLHKGVVTSNLQDVSILPHQKFDEKKGRHSINAVPNETLLEGRMTRGRRLAQLRAVERAKVNSLQDMQDSEDSSLSSAEGSSDEEEEQEGEYSDGEDEEEEIGVRRSGRLNKTEKGIRDSRATRKRGGERRAAKVDLPSESDSDASEEENETTQSAKVDESKDDTESDLELVEVKKSGPREAPGFEERIAILSGMVEVLMHTPAINEEINNGFKQVTLLEKASKEEEKEMILEQGQIMQAHCAKAPSMLEVAEFSQWKEEKNALVKKQSFALMDIKVHYYLQMEAHKSRSGPLGKDIDGNEYWQLSEYNENKPGNVQERWAWSLLVLGSDFYQPICKSSEVIVEESEKEGESKGQDVEVAMEVMGKESVLIEKESRNEIEKQNEKESVQKIKAVDDDIEEDFVVLIDLPSKSPKQKEIKEGEKWGTTSSESKVASPKSANEPPTETAKMEETKESLQTFGFSSTDNHHTIAQIKEYILYRLATKEYEELLELRNSEQVEKEEKLNASIEEQINKKAVGDIGSSTNPMALDEEEDIVARPTLSEKKRKRAELLERHANRRKEIEKLVKNIEMVRMYHQWHSDEVEGQEG